MVVLGSLSSVRPTNLTLSDVCGGLCVYVCEYGVCGYGVGVVMVWGWLCCV